MCIGPVVGFSGRRTTGGLVWSTAEPWFHSIGLLANLRGGPFGGLAAGVSAGLLPLFGPVVGITAPTTMFPPPALQSLLRPSAMPRSVGPLLPDSAVDPTGTVTLRMAIGPTTGKVALAGANSGGVLRSAPRPTVGLWVARVIGT